MAKKSQTNTHTNSTRQDESALAKFNLSFEFNNSWAEAKQDVQLHPTKTK